MNGDGVVNELDVIAESYPYDLNQSGVIDAEELAQWIADTGGSDINGDLVVDAEDVIADTCPYDSDKDGEISYDGDFNETSFPDCEFEDWLAANQGDPENPLWVYYDEVWVFTIADLVYVNQVVTNEGIKNVQIRFYPIPPQV